MDSTTSFYISDAPLPIERPAGSRDPPRSGPGANRRASVARRSERDEKPARTRLKRTGWASVARREKKSNGHPSPGHGPLEFTSSAYNATVRSTTSLSDRAAIHERARPNVATRGSVRRISDTGERVVTRNTSRRERIAEGAAQFSMDAYALTARRRAIDGSALSADGPFGQAIRVRDSDGRATSRSIAHTNAPV
jgi:hypothetical protein